MVWWNKSCQIHNFPRTNTENLWRNLLMHQYRTTKPEMCDPNKSSGLWPSEHIHAAAIKILNIDSIHPSSWVIGIEFGSESLMPHLKLRFYIRWTFFFTTASIKPHHTFLILKLWIRNYGQKTFIIKWIEHGHRQSRKSKSQNGYADKPTAFFCYNEGSLHICW